MATPDQIHEWSKELALGSTPFQVATMFGVTEPHVRKAVGISNDDLKGCDEYQRRQANKPVLDLISEEIWQLYEAKFITPEHTSEFIEALVTMSDARQVLELGMYSGFTTLHMLRAIIGKSGAKVVSVEPRPAHDFEFFAKPEISPWFEWVNGWTPQCLEQLHGRIFDFVFVDSDHSLSHTEKELEALMPITRPDSIIVFHDVQKEPTDVIYRFLERKVADGTLRGLILPTAPQQDVDRVFGPDNARFRPNLGCFMRN